MSFENRVTNLKSKISNLGLAGMYVTNLTNVRYLTGFTGSAGYLLILDNEQYFFSDGRYKEQSKEQIKNGKIEIVGSSHVKAIEKLSLLSSNMKMGFESDHVSVTLFDSFKKLFPRVSWIPTAGIIEKIAAVKDMLEIDSLKTAIEITDEVFKQIIPELKIGAIEKDISAKIIITTSSTNPIILNIL